MVERKEEVAPEEKVTEKKELTGLIKVYIEAVDLVVSFTGIKQTPAHTIREYLNLAKDKIEEKGEDFALISLITEKFLYASGGLAREEGRKAEEALERLKKKK